MQVNLLQKSQGTIFSKRIQPEENGTMLCRFSFVTNCSQPCTAIAFGLKPEPHNSEIYVGLVDNSFRAFDIDASQWTGVMRGHTLGIRAISVHNAGLTALTCSTRCALIWNLASFSRLRQLEVSASASSGITQVFFQGDLIVSCFRDDSVFVWESESLVCRLQLPASASQNREPVYRSLACSCDGRLLVAAGKSRFMDIWDLETGTLRQTIELPRPVVGVRKVLFLEPGVVASSDRQETLLAVLGEDRRVRLIQLSSCRLLCELGPNNGDPLVQAMATGGRRADKLGLVASTAGNLHLYDLGAVWRQANKLHLPIRRVWSRSGPASVSKVIASQSQEPSHDQSLTSDIPDTGGIDKVDPTKVTPSSMLERKKLRAILKEYGRFPNKYRPFIWRGLLQLPGNVAVLTALLEKGVHPSWDLLPHKYPMRSQKLTRCLQRVLSALAYWSPLFAECDFLPLLAFPFIKVFQNNLLLAFEMVATVLLNWCRDWFEYFPNPPIGVLCMVENVLAHHDEELYQHLVDLGVTTEVYAWPLLETVWSEVLTKEEWLALWDGLVCRQPGFGLLCVVAYSLCAKAALIRSRDIEQIESFYRHQSCVTATEILQRACALDATTPKELHPVRLLLPFEPLTPHQYPIFHKYPKFIVDHQIRERERIREEERDYLRQRAEAEEMQRKTEIHAAKEQSWYRTQEMLARAEDRRRLLIAEEETRLREQKMKLNSLVDRLQRRQGLVMQQANSQARHFELYRANAAAHNVGVSPAHQGGASSFEETEQAITEAENKIRELELEFAHRRGESQREAGFQMEQGACSVPVQDDAAPARLAQGHNRSVSWRQ